MKTITAYQLVIKRLSFNLIRQTFQGQIIDIINSNSLNFIYYDETHEFYQELHLV